MTTAKEHNMGFKPPMALAILRGTKTMTRRLITPRNSYYDGGPVRKARWDELDWASQNIFADKGPSPSGNTGPYLHVPDKDGDAVHRIYPRHQVGDRIWVRENWRIGAWDENQPAFALDYCDGPRKEWIHVPDPMCDDGELFERLWIQSTDDARKKYGPQERYKWEPGQSPCRWRPSIHMPRWASRITLGITGVRVEQLHEISAKDITSEGAVDRMHVDQFGRNPVSAFDGKVYMDLRSLWAAGWESINGKGSWALNPYVWVIEFRRVE